MTLIVYDTTGRILIQASGSYTVPTGVPYLEIEIQAGKILKSVDVSVTPNVPVYENIPPTPIDNITKTLSELQKQMTQVTDINLDTLDSVAKIYEAVKPFLLA